MNLEKKLTSAAHRCSFTYLNFIKLSGESCDLDMAFRQIAILIIFAINRAAPNDDNQN